MAPAESITTSRLLLRKPVAPDDAPMIHRYACDPRVTRYLTWLPHRDMEESERTLRTRVAWWDQGLEYSWVITLQESRAIVGMISASVDSLPSRYSLGYVLAHDVHGQGYATEAAGAVTERLLNLPGVTRVWAVVDEDNTASARVLEKIGMQREGLLRNWSLHPGLSPLARNCWCYARLREE